MDHTLGPWTLTELPEGKRGAAGQWVIRGNGLQLLLCLPHGTPTHEANARLIAAAPELLEACKYALSVLLEVPPVTEPLPIRSAIRKLEDVIQKAEK